MAAKPYLRSDMGLLATRNKKNSAGVAPRCAAGRCPAGVRLGPRHTFGGRHSIPYILQTIKMDRFEPRSSGSGWWAPTDKALPDGRGPS